MTGSPVPQPIAARRRSAWRRLARRIVGGAIMLSAFLIGVSELTAYASAGDGAAARAPAKRVV